MTLNPQFFKDTAGETMVILFEEEYEKLLAEIKSSTTINLDE
ncbi:MAG: hypothetical protein ACJAQR_001120 [Bacteroidia bacterium]|jgi:hypothetical protein